MNATDEVGIHQLRGTVAGGAKTVSQPTLSSAPGDFWALKRIKSNRNNKGWRRELRALVIRVSESTGVVLFNAVKADVPTQVVKLNRWRDWRVRHRERTKGGGVICPYASVHFAWT